MNINQATPIYQSKILSQIPYLIHGFSTRHLGDGRTTQGKKLILDSMKLGDRHFIQAKQVHGADVGVMNNADSGKEVVADALITTMRSDDFLLSVRVADCVPIVVVDPDAWVSGVVHAGWKGTLAGVVSKTISQMKTLGARPDNIRAAIGPHIGMCCYTVPDDRAELFQKAYRGYSNVTSFFNNMWHVDIGLANYAELMWQGVAPEHIDAPIGCTSCQIGDFYSYRKDSKETFGEILGVVGWQKNSH